MHQPSDDRDCTVLAGMFDTKLVEYTEGQLRREGINLRTSTRVVGVKPHNMSVLTPEGVPEDVPFGTLVWVAGIATRPIVQQLVDTLGQESRRGLLVDGHLKVSRMPALTASLGEVGVRDSADCIYTVCAQSTPTPPHTDTGLTRVCGVCV